MYMKADTIVSQVRVLISKLDVLQVQEKLSATEYKEFVGFMKAMKSKAMKISHVLQSIAKLFTGPERLPLLRRY